MNAPFCRTIVCLVVVLFSQTSALFAADQSRPNIVLIFADDLGYSDVGCFGAKDIRTPNIDRLANEGTRFTSFYVSQPVCTASRASLMTGCYANRIGLAGALNHTSKVGIHDDEVLLPELLQKRGYATAIFGKWHLGHQPKFSPTRHGFGEFFGIPYSNDNGPLHPVVKTIPSLPLIDEYRDQVRTDGVFEGGSGERSQQFDPDQSQFTRRLTERAGHFMAEHRDRPFFLYVPHIMPHVPIFASEKFKGRSARGLYGDVVEELDWSVGQILAALKNLKLEDKTLVIFTSDNGPFLSYGEHAGSAVPLREGKLTTFEGGVRTPCIMCWPQKIPAERTCDEPVASIDLLPTIAKLVSAPLPSQPIDGLDVWPIISAQPNARTPHESLLFYSGDELQAVRSGDWKLHFTHEYLTVAGPPGRAGKPANFEKMQPKSIEESGIRGIASRHGYEVRRIEQSLFNLKDDPGESSNVANENLDVIRRLEALAETARADLGDSLTDRRGSGVRTARRVE